MGQREGKRERERERERGGGARKDDRRKRRGEGGEEGRERSLSEWWGEGVNLSLLNIVVLWFVPSWSYLIIALRLISDCFGSDPGNP